MLLGKRPRPPVMKRTTSLTEISFDLGGGGGSSSSQQQQQQQPGQQSIDGVVSGMLSPSSPPTPRNNKTTLSRRHSADFVETPHFLRTCGLCKRRLVPGRDIYMYRGDAAFCSSECRQQQISQDERKDKCSLASSKKQQLQQQQHPVSASVASPSIKGETSVPAAVYIQ